MKEALKMKWSVVISVWYVCMAAISFTYGLSLTLLLRDVDQHVVVHSEKNTSGGWLIAPSMSTLVDLSGYSDQMFSIEKLVMPYLRGHLVREC